MVLPCSHRYYACAERASPSESRILRELCPYLNHNKLAISSQSLPPVVQSLPTSRRRRVVSPKHSMDRLLPIQKYPPSKCPHRRRRVYRDLLYDLHRTLLPNRASKSIFSFSAPPSKEHRCKNDTTLSLFILTTLIYVQYIREAVYNFGLQLYQQSAIIITES